MELGVRPPLRSVIYEIMPWREKKYAREHDFKLAVAGDIKLHKL
jgi:hypothetical protein